MLPVAELYSYIDFSEHFPLPAVENSDAWAKLLLRLRNDKKLKETVHFKRIYVDGHYRRVYDVRAVVRAVCGEAQKDNPSAQCAYLAETYYDQFLAILTSVVSRTSPPSPQDDKTP